MNQLEGVARAIHNAQWLDPYEQASVVEKNMARQCAQAAIDAYKEGLVERLEETMQEKHPTGVHIWCSACIKHCIKIIKEGTDATNT